VSACHAGFLVAKAQLKRAKNDVLDAEILAQALVPERWRPSPHIYYELQQQLAQRSSYLELRMRVSDQLRALSVGPVVVPVR